MAYGDKTKTNQYATRLTTLGSKKWKTIINAQLPYVWNISRLKPGKTLDIGCGFGRLLKTLPNSSVGVDHNKTFIKIARESGLNVYTPDKFFKSKDAKLNSFDSILLSHLLEHLTIKESLDILNTYKPYLKKGGKVIIICPQEKGFASDNTHVTFMDREKLQLVAKKAELHFNKFYSFPFPTLIGKIFTYNEFILVAIK